MALPEQIFIKFIEHIPDAAPYKNDCNNRVEISQEVINGGFFLFKKRHSLNFNCMWSNFYTLKIYGKFEKKPVLCLNILINT